MSQRNILLTTGLFCMIVTASLSFAKDYIIYSIVQDIPMTNNEPKVKKNFYVNLGKSQGLKEGNKLSVFRIISRQDPYQRRTRYNHRVKVGELSVLHVEENSAICNQATLESIKPETPMFEIGKFMIGDQVKVKIDN